MWAPHASLDSQSRRWELWKTFAGTDFARLLKFVLSFLSISVWMGNNPPRGEVLTDTARRSSTRTTIRQRIRGTHVMTLSGGHSQH